MDKYNLDGEKLKLIKPVPPSIRMLRDPDSCDIRALIILPIALLIAILLKGFGVIN